MNNLQALNTSKIPLKQDDDRDDQDLQDEDYQKQEDDQEEKSSQSEPSLDSQQFSDSSGSSSQNNSASSIPNSSGVFAKVNQQKKGQNAVYGRMLDLRRKEADKIHTKLKLNDTIAAVVALCLGFLAVLDNEFYRVEKSQDGVVVKEANQSNQTNNIIRIIICAITVVLDVLIFAHYQLSLKKSKLFRVVATKGGLCTHRMKAVMLTAELFICSILNPPYLDFSIQGTMLNGSYEYFLNDLIVVSTLCKSYLILRIFEHYSIWTSQTYTKLFKKANLKPDNVFAIKAELLRRPMIPLCLALFLTIGYAALIMRILQRNFQLEDGGSFQLNDIGNAMWLIIITMTTVGYGDLFPRTHMGRFVAIISCFVGMALVSLLVATLNRIIEFTREEQKAFTIIKKWNAITQSEKMAGNVIKTAFRLKVFTSNRLRVRNVGVNFAMKYLWFSKLRKNIQNYRTSVKVANSYNLPVDYMLTGLNTKLTLDIQDIKQSMKAFPQLRVRYQAIMEKQENYKEKIDLIQKQQDTIQQRLMKLIKRI